MNPINELFSTPSNQWISNHEQNEKQSWSNLTLFVIGVVTLYVISVIAFIVGDLSRFCYKKARHAKDYWIRELENKGAKEVCVGLIVGLILVIYVRTKVVPPQVIPSKPSWIEELKNKGAKEVCSWVLTPHTTVTIFQVEGQFFYTLIHPTYGPSKWEDTQQFSLKTDDTLSMEEKISRIQKRLPVLQKEKLIKFVRIEDMSMSPHYYRSCKLCLVDEKPIRWARFDVDRISTVIFNCHAKYHKLQPIEGGIFDSDLTYGADYFEFANDEYYASDEGKEFLKQSLPELCEFYKNNFNNIKDVLTRFRDAIQQAQFDKEALRIAFEKYIPFNARLNWMANFDKAIDEIKEIEEIEIKKTWFFNLSYVKKYQILVNTGRWKLFVEEIKVKSQLDPNITLDRDQWTATLVDTSGADSDFAHRVRQGHSSNPVTILGHAVLVIEGIRKGSPFIWRTDLRDIGIRPPQEVSKIPMKRRTRTWQVSRERVMSVVKQILEEKRTGIVSWGYMFGTDNCSTWAIKKLNKMLSPEDRIRIYPSIAEALLYHKASADVSDVVT